MRYRQYAQRHGYGVVYEYTGHGVGKALHEDPSVPNLGTPATVCACAGA